MTDPRDPALWRLYAAHRHEQRRWEAILIVTPDRRRAEARLRRRALRMSGVEAVEVILSRGIGACLPRGALVAFG